MIRWEDISLLGKMATVLFVLGKMQFIPSVIALFAFRDWAPLFLSLYGGFIGGAAFFCLIDMMFLKKKMKNLKKPPSRRQVQIWVEHYAKQEQEA